MEKDFNTNNLLNIEKDYLENISSNSVLHFFGDWIYKTDILKNKFLNAKPFEHIVIDNFLEENYAEKIDELFPKLDNRWHEYKNPIEVKYAFDNINSLSTELKIIFTIYQHLK